MQQQCAVEPAVFQLERTSSAGIQHILCIKVRTLLVRQTDGMSHQQLFLLVQAVQVGERTAASTEQLVEMAAPLGVVLREVA